METFTVQPASVYFTIIQAIKVVPRKFPVPRELRDARGPHSSLASKAQGLRQLAQLLARCHAAGRHRCSQPGQPRGSLSHKIPGIVLIALN